MVDQVRAGDPRALARAISTVENRALGWSELLKALFPHTGHARTIGLTGPPGAGKSTLVDQLARHYRKENRTVGIIAVDPTSPYTGGAILGDRIRMQDHFSDPGIYIRSMATRGSLGGLARTTADVARTCHLATPTASKLLNQLQRAGLVESTRGLHGGYRLARPRARSARRPSSTPWKAPWP